VRLQQAFEEPFCRCAIPSGLQEDINEFAILINSAPQVVLLAVNFHEGFIDEECVTVSSVPPILAISDSYLSVP
jgi:hypothetical protein